MSDIWTIRSLLKWTTDFFVAKNIPTPRLDAEILLAKSLNSSRLQLYLDPDRPVSVSERETFRELVKMRAVRKPIAYLVGYKEFWSRSIYVDESVLIPRPESEGLVALVKQRLKNDTYARILDLGTGSGCLTLAIAQELPAACFWCVDVSPSAVKTARLNFTNHEVIDRVCLFCGSWYEPIQGKGLEKSFNAIISNPPYLKTSAIDHELQPEISRYEPRLALDGGDEGLSAYSFLGAGAGIYLCRGGLIAVEIGMDQGELVSGIFNKAGLINSEILKDDAGLDRFVVAYCAD